MTEFKGRTVLVTGASTAIGFATAKKFCNAGAKVLITGSVRDRVEKAADELGEMCIGLVADNTSPDTPQAIAEACTLHLGHLDVMVLNAGVEAGLTAMKRLGQASEIADAFYYLAGGQASYVTAIDLRVDGGWGDV